MSESIAILQKERDDARAACAEMRELIASAYYLIVEHHSNHVLREDLIICPACNEPKGDAILSKLFTIKDGSAEAGKGWLSPEKRKTATEYLKPLVGEFQPPDCDMQWRVKETIKLLETE